MKKLVLVIATIIMGISIAIPVQSVKAAQKEHHKTLVVYFSWSGTTKVVAETVHKKVGGKLVRLQPQKKYSSSYDEVSKRAGKEYFGHLSPKVKTRIKNMDQYTDVFIGFPIWYSTAPMLIKSFLKQYNLNNKNIYPFTTFSSDRLGKSMKLIHKAVPKAKIKGGLPVDDTENPRSEINHWLKEIDYK